MRIFACKSLQAHKVTRSSHKIKSHQVWGYPSLGDISIYPYKTGLVGNSCYFCHLCHNRKTHLEVNIITACIFFKTTFWKLQCEYGLLLCAKLNPTAVPVPQKKRSDPIMKTKINLSLLTHFTFLLACTAILYQKQGRHFFEEQRKHLNTTVKMANANSPINLPPHTPSNFVLEWVLFCSYLSTALSKKVNKLQLCTILC